MTAPPRRRWLLTALLAVVIPALVGVLVVQVQQRLEADAADAARVAARDAAERQVLNLVNLDQDSLEERFDDLAEGSTEDFAGELEGITETFGQVVAQGGVRSEGEVTATGVADQGEGRVDVLVAVTASVVNEQAPEGEARNYRLDVALVQRGDRWLVSGMEFVS